MHTSLKPAGVFIGVEEMRRAQQLLIWEIDHVTVAGRSSWFIFAGAPSIFITTWAIAKVYFNDVG